MMCLWSREEVWVAEGGEAIVKGFVNPITHGILIPPRLNTHLQVLDSIFVYIQKRLAQIKEVFLFENEMF